MADSYEDSLRKTSIHSRCRSYARYKLRLCKRRKISSMEFLPHHACVARFEEPIFCSNSLAALSSQQHCPGSIPFLTSLYGRSTNEEIQHTIEEPLGVPAGPGPRQREQMDFDADSETFRPLMTATTEPNAAQQGRVHEPSSLVRAYYPEAETIEARVEDERRRIRFLADLNDEDEACQHRLRASDHGEGQGLPRHEVSRQIQEDTEDHATSELLEGFNSEMSAIRTEPPALALLNSTIHPSIIDFLDDDTLPVDHPRRSYDFADFMDTWRLQCLAAPVVSSFEPGFQDSFRVQQSDEVTRTQVEMNETDMQGLRWKLLGPDREHALASRIRLHPTRQPTIGGDATSEDPRSYNSSSQFDGEPQYRFRAFHPKHCAHFSHYQLRNVLCASSRNAIYYATGSKVMHTSLACPSISKSVLDLWRPSESAMPFRITCLSTPQILPNQQRQTGVLFAGGFYGEYAMLDLTSESESKPVEGFVSHSSNGLVNHIQTYPHRRSGLLQAAFCSNDRRVRVMDVKTLRFTDTFTYEHAINCPTTSPDGRLRVLVGDSNETLITNADNGESLVTLQGHSDHGFACAWSGDGTFVATGAQDGKVLVWDTRRWSAPLTTLDTVMSCARSLHFTEDVTLIVGESDDVVSIYSAREFNSRQDIRFFGSIGGVAVLDGGAEIVVANVDRTVGGLLSFQRMPRGCGSGSAGTHAFGDVEGRRRSPSRTVRSVEAGWDFATDVVV